MMDDTLKLILSLSFSAGILAVLIFAVKPLIRHKLSKSIQYYIWIIVLLRLVLPFSFETSFMNELFYGSSITGKVSGPGTVKDVHNQSGKNVTHNNLSAGTGEDSAIVINSEDNNPGRSAFYILGRYAVYIWLVGFIISISVNLTGYLRFLKLLKQSGRPADEEEYLLLKQLANGKKDIRLIRNRYAGTPMLTGIIKPCIIIPDIDFNKNQLKNILLHELSHLKHFDIGIKWLAMFAVSIHWFNPVVYFIRKEVNHACELACDERVIKNLSDEEKQDYGNTLISVVAYRKYPMGVLQATMCEEKQSLKERLTAIMKHNKKSKWVILLSAVLIFAVAAVALYLGAGTGIGSKTPPELFINAENLKTKVAQTGTYSWSYRGTNVEADSDDPVNFKYNTDNIVAASAGQKLTLGAQNLKSNKKVAYTLERISVYKDKQPIKYDLTKSSLSGGNLYIQAPDETGEYIYSLVLKFNNGTASYGFVIRVDMPVYDLEDISKYKTQYIGDASKVGSIAGKLSAADSYFRQQYISMETAEKPYKLTIYYEPASDSGYKGEWPVVSTGSSLEKNSRKNALVVLCMIDNLDEITFAYRTTKSGGKLEESKYDTTFSFPRKSFEEMYGNLKNLGNDLTLLEDILAGKVYAETSPSYPVDEQIEKYLGIIMEGPGMSSNPHDYIRDHMNEYKNIMNMGDEALEYLLSEFKKGNNNDLRGHIMMALCKELLGEKNTVTDERLPPQDWYSKFSAESK